jgi:hypothetical protein
MVSDLCEARDRLLVSGFFFDFLFDLESRDATFLGNVYFLEQLGVTTHEILPFIAFICLDMHL